MNVFALGHRSSFDLKARNQTGVNMVDLMMWLVIASLLLATAIQSIAYYQRGVYVYTIKTALEGAGSITMVRVGEEGRITKTALDSGVSETKRSDEITYKVATPENGAKPYIVASHPAVPHVDGIYLFESCGDTYPVGVSMIPKGGTPILEACGVTTTPTEESGGSTTPPAESPAADSDTTPATGGETTPESPTGSEPAPTDPEATPTDPEATPTDPDTTTAEPDSSTTPTEPPPARASCSSTMTVDQEAECWGDFIMEEELSFETRTGLYFGINESGDDPVYDRDSLDDMPLTHREHVQFYRDGYGGDWDYNWAQVNVLDRDGDLWQGELYNEYNQPNGLNVGVFAQSIVNTNYHCDSISPGDYNSVACAMVGIPHNLHRVNLPDNDATADADIAKVINAQYAKLTGKTRSLYGAFNTVTDVTSFAATTYPTKVWNEDRPSEVTVHIRVATPSGDGYHASYTFAKTNPTKTRTYYEYRFTSYDVEGNCTRPIVRPVQDAEIPYCQMAGYTAFKR